jgi:hypothetical protein
MEFKDDQLDLLVALIRDAKEIALSVDSKYSTKYYNLATSVIERSNRFLNMIRMAQYMKQNPYQTAAEVLYLDELKMFGGVMAGPMSEVPEEILRRLNKPMDDE